MLPIKLFVISSFILACAVMTFGLNTTHTINSNITVDKLGAQVFENNCTACHAGGNNTVETAKTLKLEALKTNGFNSAADIHKRVEEGKGVMPVFKDTLKPAEIDAVAEYVWAQAQKGWK